MKLLGFFVRCAQISVMIIAFLYCFVSPLKLSAQQLTPQEKQLYQDITDYRAAYKLPSIPLSPALITVAKLHVRDLSENPPDGTRCNYHSWSDKGSWFACCYTEDHAKAQCMWDKPRELTTYIGNGYEIAEVLSNCENCIITPEMALDGWKHSPGHNSTILNLDIWKTHPWQAIGIAIYGGIAVVWFGEEPDPESK